MSKKESPRKSVPSKAKNTSPRSNRPTKATPKARSGPSTEPDAKLSAWLKAQATKLKALVRKGNILKLDFVLNAKQKGDILLKVRDRLSGIPGRFESWVREETDLGYSTALLWIDVAQNYDDVSEQFANSNPLELTVRQIRDAIRDARQKRGEGKPGSGRRKPKATETPNDGENGDVTDNTEVEADHTDIEDDAEEATPDNNHWEKTAAEAEAEAAQVDDGETKEPEKPLYKVVVFVGNEGDQDTIYQALSNWSPIRVKPMGTKQTRSVSAHVQPKSLGTLLQKLGKALEANQPKSVKKVSIDL